MAATHHDALQLASTCSGWSKQAFMITGIGVHDRVDWVFTITGIRTDETVVPMLDPGRGRTKQGYFWAIARDDRPPAFALGHAHM